MRQGPILRLWDAHSHPLEVPQHLHRLADLKSVHRVGVQSAKEEEWAACEAAAMQYGCVIPGFGVHPWFAHRVADGWLERLRRRLEGTPHCFMGEIGLDKVAITPDTQVNEWDSQVQVFRMQLELAAQLAKPVSIHAVQCWGVMFDFFSGKETPLPPRVMLHSFGGSIEMVKSFMALEKKRSKAANPLQFYFSFSTTINGRAPKTSSVVAAVPEERLLIESDHNDAEQIDESMNAACQLVADARGWTLEKAADTTARNAARFFAM